MEELNELCEDNKGLILSAIFQMNGGPMLCSCWRKRTYFLVLYGDDSNKQKLAVVSTQLVGNMASQGSEFAEA